jgi:hypothetical protein
MAEERPLVHLFLIQKNMPYDALQAVSRCHEMGDIGGRGEKRRGERRGENRKEEKRNDER